MLQALASPCSRVALSGARTADPELATKVATQLFSNALITAGLLDDPRVMLPNVNAILTDVLRPHAPPAAAAFAPPKEEAASAANADGAAS